MSESETQCDAELNPFIDKRRDHSKEASDAKLANTGTTATSGSKEESGSAAFEPSKNTVAKNVAIFCVIFVLLLALVLSGVSYLTYINRDTGGDTVGLEVRPVAGHSEPLVAFESYRRWRHTSDRLVEFLRPYRRLADHYQYVNGVDNNCSAVVAGQLFTTIEHYYYCLMKADGERNCSEARDYGYMNGDPCVALRFNHGVSWPTPETVNRLYIGQSTDKDVPNVARNYSGRQSDSYVNFECAGESALDRENIGPIDYYPSQRLPLKYFSAFRRQPHYLPPFVLVHFGRPARGLAIGVVCRVWPNHNSVMKIKFDLIDDSA